MTGRGATRIEAGYGATLAVRSEVVSMAARATRINGPLHLEFVR